MAGKWAYRVNGRKPVLRPIEADGHAGGVPRKIETTYAGPDEHIYTDEEFEFLKAIHAYKVEKNRPYPTWKETLDVLKGLGWEKARGPGMAALVEDYVRNCEVVRVIDGDTVVLDIDCGFRIWMRQTVRLLGVNCPEVKGKTWEAGERAKQFTLTWLHVAPFVVKTHLDKTDSFGRILAECWRGAASLTTALIESGHGVAYRAETEQ